MTSPLIQAALDQQKLLRAEHHLIVESDYAAAELATNGAMLNERGQRAGINPFHLFTHNHTYFLAYASPELVEWREQHPHLPFKDYERAMLDQEPF